MTTQFIDKYLDEKMKKDPFYIICTYFDMREPKRDRDLSEVFVESKSLFL